MTRESSELFHQVAIRGGRRWLERGEGWRKREREEGEKEEEGRWKKREGERDGGDSSYTGKQREEGGWGRERREQTDLRSFIFLAIIFFREKNPSPFHFVFISVVNASNETSDLQRCSRKDESSSAPPLFRIVTGVLAIRGEGRGVIFRDIGAGLRFSSFFLSCFVRLLREAYVIIGEKHWSRKSLAKCLLVVGE